MMIWGVYLELLHYGRRVGEEEKTEIRVVSGETNLILRTKNVNIILLGAFPNATDAFPDTSIV